MKIKRKGKNDYNFIKMKNNRIQLPTRELVEIKLQLKLINVMVEVINKMPFHKINYGPLIGNSYRGDQAMRNSFIKEEYKSKEFGRNL